MVAVCPTRRVGVDIEAMTAAAEVGEVACHPDERPRDAIAATRLWVRKEALLKAHGAGLTVDPRTVCLSPDGEVLAGPPGVIVDVDAAPQWTCAVAVAGQSSSVDVRMVSVEDW